MLSSLLTQLKLQFTKNLLKSATSQIIAWIGHAAVEQPSLIASKQLLTSPSTSILSIFSAMAICNAHRIVVATACTGSHIS